MQKAPPFDPIPMAFASSYTATLSPMPKDASSSHMLGSSISSLASSTSSRHTSNTSKIYRQSSTLFLTRRLPEALSTILPLTTPLPAHSPDDPLEPAPVARSSRTTRIKVWSLYLTILNAIVELDSDEGKDAFGAQEWRAICSKVREGEVWEEVVKNGYHGVEGDVDSDVVINLATLLLAHARTQTLNQKRLENYLAASTTPHLDLSDHFASSPSTPSYVRGYQSPSKGRNDADTPRDLNARVKILELYTLHVLLRNNQWDYAREFISASPILDDERREAFLQALQSLQDEQHEAERRERHERERQEDQLQRDLEEARRLQAENEVREKRRLEEERARRGGSEVDYGVEQSPSTSGSNRGSHVRRRPSTPQTPRSAGAKSASSAKTWSKGKSVGAPSLGARAGLILSHIRALMEQMSASIHANPMLLMRFLAFIASLALMFGKRSVRERVMRILATSWAKVRATAGMGVKVSYI